ncbi:MAG: SpoIIE family protein phosphatase [Bacteroidota bacterium]
MSDQFYIEVHCQQKNHEGERICGDVFLSKRVIEEKRVIVVLSDGMGHGVKANILATLTATMSLNFVKEHKDFKKIAETIMKTLPVCSVRHISYSTFTIVDVEMDGKVRVLEYDNPGVMVLRDGEIIALEPELIELDIDKSRETILKSYTFYPKKEDRLIICSDGVAQSGLGSKKYPFGWQIENVARFIKDLVETNEDISAKSLANKVVNISHANDNYHSKDDTSCAVLYFRNPRKLLICTGPPFEDDNDKVLGDLVREFDGTKIVCGATTADIVSRELQAEIVDSFEFDDPDLPPISFMEGVDLITEGILTLGKTHEILKTYNNNTRLGKGPADRIVKLLLDSDEIHFVVGTRINIAHQDPNLPVELEIRRTVIKRIARVLEDKYLKEVQLRFL